MNPRHGLYAYGLVGKIPEGLDILGIDKSNKVFPVIKGDVCMLVSEVDIDEFQEQVKHLLSELTNNAGTVRNEAGEILQAHEHVIDILMQDTTVVPLKFGTIFNDEKAAQKMLQDHEEEFKNLLTKFARKVEWGLKVYVDKQALMQHIVQTEPKLTNLRDKQERLSRGAQYLLRRKMEEEVEALVASQLVQMSREIFQEIAKAACEARLNETLPQKVTGKKKEMILNAAFLVERQKAARLRQRGKSFIDKYKFMGLNLEFSGPWPPYNFT